MCCGLWPQRKPRPFTKNGAFLSMLEKLKTSQARQIGLNPTKKCNQSYLEVIEKILSLRVPFKCDWMHCSVWGLSFALFVFCVCVRNMLSLDAHTHSKYKRFSRQHCGIDKSNGKYLLFQKESKNESPSTKDFPIECCFEALSKICGNFPFQIEC